jgi:hypothetical protein
VTFSVVLLMGAWVAGDAATIDRALSAALDYDSRAYIEACYDRHCLEEFHALQQRARELNERYASKLSNGDIVLRYVDRRPVRACGGQKHFRGTIAKWKHALDEIELALNGAG